jgi:hypothetical protein
MCLKFGFVIFWQKDFGTKAAHKMLVKLTPAYYGVRRLRINNVSTVQAPEQQGLAYLTTIE